MRKQGDDLAIVLTLDGNDFEVGIRGAGRLLTQFEGQAVKSSQNVKKLDASVEGLAGKTRDLTIVLATAEQALRTIGRVTFGWQKSIMDAAGEIEKLTVMMKGMSSEADMTKRNLDAIADAKFVTDFAQQAPFAMESITDTFIKFRTVGIEPTDGSMRALTDAVATFGGGSDILHRASIAIQQMAGKGVISMEELRQQLGEAVPSAMKIMARSMNMSVGELVGLIETGTVESRSAINKMLAEMALTFDGAGVRMMSTWQGVLQSMETRWKLFLKEVAGDTEDGTSYFNTIKDMVDRLSQWLTTSGAKQFAAEISDGLSKLAMAMETVLRLAYENRAALIALAKVFAVWFVASRLTMGLNAVVSALTSINMATGMVGQGISNYRRHMEAARTTISATSTAMDAATSVANRKSIALSGLAGTVGRVGLAFASLAGPIGMAISVLVTAGYALWNLRKNTDDLANSIIRTRGLIATQEDLETMEGRRGAVDGELREVFGQINAKDRELRSARTEEMRRQIQEQIDNLIKEQGELRREAQLLDHGIRTAVDGMRITAVESARSSVLRAIQVEFDPISAEFERFREEIGAEMQGASDDANKWADVVARSTEAANRNYEQKLEVLERLQKSHNDTIKLYAGKNDTESRRALAEAEAGLAEIEARRQEAERMRDTFIRETSRVNELIEKPSRAKPKTPEFIKDSERALKSMEGVANGFAIRLAQARGKAEEINPHLEGLNERISQLQEMITGKDQAMFDNLADQAREFARELHNIERLKKAEQDGHRAYMQLLSRTSGLLEDTEEGRLMRLQLQTMELEEQMTQYEELLEKMREAGVDPLQVQRYADAMRQYHIEAMRDIERNAESSWDRMIREMNDFKMDWANLWKDTADLAIDEIVRFAKEGKFEFSKLIEYVLEQMLRVQMQQAVIAPLTNMMNGFVSGWTGGGASAGAQAAGTDFTSIFANGGIMSDKGSMPLQRYANGGIAHKPQVAIFGEGAHREAYVPLPDGRTIPVTMSGGGAPNIQFNLINQSGQQVEAEQTGGRFDGETYVLDVVLKAMGRPGNFRDSMKGAMKQ